jgi:integrase
MATGRITKSAIDNLHAGERDKLLWDEKLSGFGVKVTPKGKKVFVFQYRLGGRGAKVRRYTIGQFGAFTAEKGRQEAERLSRLVAQGIDPQSDKVDRQRAAVELAFSGYVDRFEKDCLEVKWKASAGEARSMLDRYAVPVLKQKPLPDINRRDIQAVLDPLNDMPASASKMFAILRRMFNFAVARGDLDSSPLDGMEPPPVPDARDRVLEDLELALIWKASGDLGDPFGPWVRLLILTGARREEVAGLSWKELRQDQKLWKLPAERAKNDRAYDIPLSDSAVEAIDGLAKGKRWPKRGLLFSTTGKTSVSGYSRAKTRLDKLIAKLNDKEPLDHWVWHDLRRTLATGMQRLGVRFEVTEAILNHVGGSRSGVAGIYQRHDWRPEKARALQAWSAHISGLVTSADKSNVVNLPDLKAC